MENERMNQPELDKEVVEEPNSEQTEPTAPELDLTAEEQAHQDWTAQPAPKKRGRPWGAKTRPKHVRGVSEYLESYATDDERRH